MGLLLVNGLGVLNALVKDTAQDLVEASGNVVQVLQGEFTLIQLAVSEHVVDDLLDHALDAGRGGVRQGPGGRLHLVRQEHQPGFLGLGPGARVAVILHLDLVGFGRLRLGLVEKIADEVGAVVLTDDISDVLPQPVFPGQVHPVLDMGDQDQAAHGRGQLLVLVVAALLVFHEIGRLLDLADVVVKGGGLGQHGIGPDGLRGGFHHLAHHHGVMIGPRGDEHQLFEHGLIQVQELQQADIGGVAEQ